MNIDENVLQPGGRVDRIPPAHPPGSVGGQGRPASRVQGQARLRRDSGAGGRPRPPPADAARFVIQEHHATRLHWDLRLEHDGVLASWAIPNGMPPRRRSDNRMAVHTEDHPLEYLDFHGEIPKGSYGAGTMTIWDRGTYEMLEVGAAQGRGRASTASALDARYALFPIGKDAAPKDWMIHRMDPPADPTREPMPEHVVPMLARLGALPRDDDALGVRDQVGRRARDRLLASPGGCGCDSRNRNDDHRALSRSCARLEPRARARTARCSTARSSPSTSDGPAELRARCSGACT